MRANVVRDLFLRLAVHLVVAAVFLAPLGTVGLNSGIDLRTFVSVADEAEGEAYGVAKFLTLPEVVDPTEDETPPVLEAEQALAPALDPILPPSGEEGIARSEGGSAPDGALVDGGPDSAGDDGEGATEGTGDGEATAAVPGRKRPGGARTAKGRKKNCEKTHPNVRKGGDGTIEIDRALVEHYTENLESFMKLGYSHPYDEGDVHGWYVSGFSCTSPVSKAGFERGDVLLAVNGKKTRSWVGVFMLYQKLKKKDDFTVDLVRDGAPVTLRFRVVEGGGFAG